MSNTKVNLKVKDIVKLFSELDPEQNLCFEDAEPFIRGFIDGIRDQDFNIDPFYCPYKNEKQYQMYVSMFKFGEVVFPFRNGKNFRLEYLSIIKDELSSKMNEDFMKPARECYDAGLENQKI